MLCEKPVAMNAAEAAQLADVAAQTGLRAIEAFHDHYHPLAGHLIELRRSGALGDITAITTSFTADNPYFPGSIRHVPELGGGALMELGCYPVHWIRDFLGAEPVVTSAIVHGRTGGGRRNHQRGPQARRRHHQPARQHGRRCPVRRTLPRPRHARQRPGRQPRPPPSWAQRHRRS